MTNRHRAQVIEIFPSVGQAAVRFSGRNSKRYTDIARMALEKLSAMLNSYRRDDSDGMTDYFDTNFYGHASIDYTLERNEEAAILAE